MNVQAISSELIEIGTSTDDADTLRGRCLKLARAVLGTPVAPTLSQPEQFESKGPSLLEYGRAVLSSVCVTDSDFEAFVLDNFGTLSRQFSSGMDRNQKTSLLLHHVNVEVLLERLLYEKRSQATRVIAACCPTDSDFESMVQNCFPDVQKRFSTGMDRLQKVTMLKTFVSPGRVAQACHRYNSDAAMASVKAWR